MPYTLESTLFGLIKDNAGLIEKQTQCLVSLKKSFDSGFTVQTAIVSFRIQEDVSKIRKWIIGCLCIVRSFDFS
jgi:hypothetical protein